MIQLLPFDILKNYGLALFRQPQFIQYHVICSYFLHFNLFW